MSATKKISAVRLTGTEIKARRVLAEASAGYTPLLKTYVGGKTTEVIANEAFDHLLVGNLDEAKTLIDGLRRREIANRLTFHP